MAAHEGRGGHERHKTTSSPGVSLASPICTCPVAWVLDAAAAAAAAAPILGTRRGRMGVVRGCCSSAAAARRSTGDGDLAGDRAGEAARPLGLGEGVRDLGCGTRAGAR